MKNSKGEKQPQMSHGSPSKQRGSLKQTPDTRTREQVYVRDIPRSRGEGEKPTTKNQ
jgi:hypothetical protein